MKTSLKRWVGRVPDISAVIARFPIAVVLMAIFTLILIITNKSRWDDELGRAMVGLIIAAYTSVSITLAGEANERSRRYILQGVVAAIILALAWFSEALRLNLAMAVGAVILLLGNMALWRKSRDDLHLWDFTHKLWTGAIFATFGSIIFFLGVMAIQAALKTLFGLRIDNLNEHLILPIGLGFLAPLYWMSTLPAVDEPYEELYEAPGFVSKAVAFLGTWLLAPLTLIYAAIILAYGVKIILAGSLPKGEIAQLVTPFLIIGTLTWLLLEPPFVKTKMLSKIFRKAWFPISIPAALLLAVAVFTRVNEYGLTPDRIALIFAVLWALGLGGWYNFSPKEKRDIRLIPGLASVLLIIGVFVSGWLSISNQTSRLDSYLTKAGITASMQGEVTDKEAARKAKGAIDYLYRHNAKDRLKASLAKVGYSEQALKLNDIYDALALKDVQVPSRYPKQSSHRKSYRRDKAPVDIHGYAALSGPFHYNSRLNHSGAVYRTTMKDIKVRQRGNILLFSRFEADLDNHRTFHEFDLLQWVSSLPVDGNDKNKFALANLLVPIYSDEDTRITLVVDSINERNDGEGLTTYTLHYFLLSGTSQK